MTDKEIDKWLCAHLKLPEREFTSDDLFNIITYFFPSAEFCSDEKLIAESGCAYIKLSAKDDKDRAILISDPTKEKVNQVLYVLAIAIAAAVKEKKNEINFAKFV